MNVFVVVVYISPAVSSHFELNGNVRIADRTKIDGKIMFSEVWAPHEGSNALADGVMSYAWQSTRSQFASNVHFITLHLHSPHTQKRVKNNSIIISKNSTLALTLRDVTHD